MLPTVRGTKWCSIDDKHQDCSETGDYLAPLAYGDPAAGDFSDARVIRKFGDVPGDPSAL
jgi:hypothetical protein